MGYSQVFTYVYLGVLTTHAARITDGIVNFHTPLDNTSFFERTMIEEIEEENKDDRDALRLDSKEYDTIASLVSPISPVAPVAVQAYRYTPFQYHTLAQDSSLRLCVFRV